MLFGERESIEACSDNSDTIPNEYQKSSEKPKDLENMGREALPHKNHKHHLE